MSEPLALASEAMGHWVARLRPGHVATQSHLVESAIADRVVTRCGRQMHLHSAKGELYLVGEVTGAAGRLCRVCWHG